MTVRKNLEVLTEKDPDDTDHVAAAIVALYSGFVWSKTDQGHAYWSEVVRNLKQINEEARYPETT